MKRETFLQLVETLHNNLPMRVFNIKVRALNDEERSVYAFRSDENKQLLKVIATNTNERLSYVVNLALADNTIKQQLFELYSYEIAQCLHNYYIPITAHKKLEQYKKRYLRLN